MPGTNLRDADLFKAILFKTNLPGANLSGADLRSAELAGADMRNAYCEAAGMIRAKLRNVDLSGANLRGAILTDSNLTGANLNGADLSGAVLLRVNLTDAVLRWANLTGADLAGAELDGADLEGTVLTGAKGLERKSDGQAASKAKGGLRYQKNVSDARRAAKEIMGDGVIITSAVPGRTYHGEIAAVIDSIALMAISDGHVVLHDIKKSRDADNLETGKDMTLVTDAEGYSSVRAKNETQSQKREGLMR